MASKKTVVAEETPVQTGRGRPRKNKKKIEFGTPIDTPKFRMEVKGTIIRWTIKATGEVLEKDYAAEEPADPVKRGEHAVMIIHGRIAQDPDGKYAQACINKIRAEAIKSAEI